MVYESYCEYSHQVRSLGGILLVRSFCVERANEGIQEQSRSLLLCHSTCCVFGRAQRKKEYAYTHTCRGNTSLKTKQLQLGYKRRWSTGVINLALISYVHNDRAAVAVGCVTRL